MISIQIWLSRHENKTDTSRRPLQHSHGFCPYRACLHAPGHGFAGFVRRRKKEEQSLDQAANDPTASLMSVQIQDVYAGNYHKLDNENGNTLLLRSAVPFEVGGLNNIARATLPIVTKSPSGASGLSDLVLFDLIVFNQSWGRWGVGASHAVSDRHRR